MKNYVFRVIIQKTINENILLTDVQILKRLKYESVFLHFDFENKQLASCAGSDFSSGLYSPLHELCREAATSCHRLHPPFI
jgi:hypothetical protein